MQIIKTAVDDDRNPRFSWILAGTSANGKQGAYQLQVSSGGQLVWDSQVVSSPQSVLVDYTGPSLAQGVTYGWQVRACVDDCWTDWVAGTGFETALAQFNAPFVVGDDTPEDSKALAFRKIFLLKKPVKQLKLYMTTLGIYEASMNGKPITDTCFNPGWTSYHKRQAYQSYDLTDQVQAGENTLMVYVGPGWHKGDLGFRIVRNLYSEQLALAAQIAIVYADGDKETLITDTSYQYADCQITYSELYHGEVYDANRPPVNWQSVQLAEKAPAPAVIVPCDGVPVRRQERFKPLGLIITPKGERVLDFGQNLAGRVRFKVRGQQGERVVIRHAEVLDAAGNFYTDNLRYAKCTNTYILSGEGEEIYEPLFTFQGFRYVCVDHWPGELNLADFEAVAIYSDMPVTGTFSCDNPLINQLQSNIAWGLKGNFLDIPTDCPQRDERLGWTGDAQVFIHVASYLHDVRGFFRKWLRDLAVDQRDNGSVPFVVPDMIPDMIGKISTDEVLFENATDGACGWADAATIIPWALYQYYGDRRLLVQQYPSMKGWVDHIRARATNHLFDSGFHFGDWVALDAEPGSYFGATPTELCATAYYALSTDILAKTATVLGHEGDATFYRALHQDIVAAYQQAFFTPTGDLVANTQTAHILSLMFGLTPTRWIARTTEGLVQLIQDHGGHLVTGFLGTPYVCHALSQNGQLAQAYQLLMRQDYPSWLFQVNQGATTIWEHMDGIKADGSMWSADMNSFNHYAYGSVGDWLYQVVAGITPSEPGYKAITIAPKPGGGLTQVQAKLMTPYGEVQSAWHWVNDCFNLEVTVPFNTTATVVLPDTTTYHVGPGAYRYEVTY